VIESVLTTAEHLKTAGAANEANTKHHVIEPVLAALDWNLNDFSEVDREYKVFDGTFLDYALRANGLPKLFVEAKAIGKTLADKQFIAQTVNYANNEGVVWCVLTNGLVYQVYKSNEAVPMDRKLLFEVDLAGAAADGDLAQTVKSLEVLRRSSVEAGHLDLWGETVFTDMRVRTALSTLASAPAAALVDVISAAVEGPKIEKPRLQQSVKRILGGLGGVAPAGGLVGSPPVEKPLPESPTAKPPTDAAKKRTYAVEDHTGKRPASIVDLFEKLDAFALSLGPDVVRRPTKYYIGYYAGKKSFFTAELQKAKIWVYLSIPPSEATPWDDSEMRDVTTVGHFGMGDTEFRFDAPDQLPRLEALISAAYLRNRK